MIFHRSNFFLSLFLAIFLGLSFFAWADDEISAVPDPPLAAPAVKTGVIKIESKRQVFLYIPTRYKATRPYPLIISLPGEKDPEKHVNEWASLAEQWSYIILSPALDIRSGDTPYQQDKWILQLKEDLAEHYNIAQNKVFLVGNGRDAHYAAYLSTNYSQEFAGVALIRGGWAGHYSSLMRIQEKAENQLPILIAVDQADTDLVQKIENDAAELQKVGYLVEIEKINQETLVLKDFYRKSLDWLFEKSDAWQDHIKNQQKNWKEKTWETLKHNIVIES